MEEPTLPAPPHVDVDADASRKPLAEFPPPPRAVTDAVNRRTWAEPRVRLWWVTALALVVIAVCAAADGVYGWRQDMALVRHGVPVAATVVRADGDPRRGESKPPESAVELTFPWQGQQVGVAGKLEDRHERIVVLSQVPIRVDASDPTRWTARLSPVPLWPDLLGSAIALAAAAVTWAVAAARRAAVRRTWQGGDAVPATVLDARSTALAPKSQLVRCVPSPAPRAPGTGGGPGGPLSQAEHDRRVVEVYVPLRVARPAKGDVLWVLYPPGRPTGALAAAWFE